MLIDRAAKIFAHVEQVDFNVRAVALAREIIDADPDVVSLQELSLWQTAPLSNPRDVTTRYDFLAILLRELERQGSPYEAAVVNPTFSGALPIGATTLAMFTDRNATIVRADGAEPEVTTDDPRRARTRRRCPRRSATGSSVLSRMGERRRARPGSLVHRHRHAS